MILSKLHSSGQSPANDRAETAEPTSDERRRDDGPAADAEDPISSAPDPEDGDADGHRDDIDDVDVVSAVSHDIADNDTDSVGDNVADNVAENVINDVADDLAALQRRVDELETLNRELSDRYVRLVAEFDNYRRRTRQNEDAVRATAAEALMVDLLPVLDNLQLAIGAAGDELSGPFGQGVSLISQQLSEVLSRHGLKRIDVEGQPFDPNTMEAVARGEPSDDVPEGHVIEEYRRGYKLREKLLPTW